MSSSIRFDESIRWEFVRPVRSHTNGELVLIRRVRRIKQARLRPSDTKSFKMNACPRPHEGIKHARLHPASMKSHERSASPRLSGMRNQVRGTSFIQDEVMRRSACTRPSDTRNQVGGTSSIQYDDARKENLSSSVRYEESIRQEFVCPVRSCVKGELVLVRTVRGIKLAGLRLSGTKVCMWKAHSLPSGMRNQAGGTSSASYEVARLEC